MREKLLQLLLRIHNGESIFRPEDSSVAALERFQESAKILKRASDSGLLEETFFSRNHSTGKDCYDFIRLKNGLSFRGMQCLENESGNL